MKTLFGINIQENKDRIFLLIITAIMYGIGARLINLFYILDTYISLDPGWENLAPFAISSSIPVLLISIFIFKKEKYRNYYIYFGWICVFLIPLLLIFNDLTSLFIICLLTFIFFSIVAAIIFHIPGSLAKIEFRGRIAGLYILLSFSSAGFFYFISLFIQFSVFIVMVTISLGILLILNMKIFTKKEAIFDIQDTIEKGNDRKTFIQYLIPIFLVSFVLYIFGALTIMFYPEILTSIYESLVPTEFLQTRMIDFTFSYLFPLMGIGAFVAGFLADRLGRRQAIITMIILFFIGIFELTSQLLGIPIFLNIIIVFFKGFCIGIPWMLAAIIGHDIFQKDKSFSFTLLAYLSIQLTFGLSIYVGLALIPLGNIIIFPIVLACFGVMGVLIVFVGYTKETLPSKEEIEWKTSLHEFFCITSESGVCLFHYDFLEASSIDPQLFAGGLSGVCTLVQEMTQSRKRTKVIDQEDKKLLLEFGEYVTCVLLTSSNLELLRNKLKELVQEIEFLFKDELSMWTGKIDVFKPIGKLIKRYFM